MEGLHDLLERARVGDQRAWECLHLSFQSYLLRQAQEILGPDWPERSVSDLVQDTWLRAMTRMDQFAGGPDDLQTAALMRAWLRKILRSVHANVIRDSAAAKRNPRAAVVGLHAGAVGDSANGFVRDVPGREMTASRFLSQTEEQARVREALARLPKLERDIIRLHVLDNFSMPEIASQLHLSYEKVRYRKDEALRLLGEDLVKSP